MKSSIKIIKRKRNENSDESMMGKTEKTAERSTREMVSVVKGWIDELHQKRRNQANAGFKLSD